MSCEITSLHNSSIFLNVCFPAWKVWLWRGCNGIISERSRQAQSWTGSHQAIPLVAIRAHSLSSHSDPWAHRALTPVSSWLCSPDPVAPPARIVAMRPEDALSYRTREGCSAPHRCFVHVMLQWCLPLASFRGSPTYGVCSVGAGGQGRGKGVYVKRASDTGRAFFMGFMNEGIPYAVRPVPSLPLVPGGRASPSVTPEFSRRRSRSGGFCHESQRWWDIMCGVPSWGDETGSPVTRLIAPQQEILESRTGNGAAETPTPWSDGLKERGVPRDPQTLEGKSLCL